MRKSRWGRACFLSVEDVVSSVRALREVTGLLVRRCLYADVWCLGLLLVHTDTRNMSRSQSHTIALTPMDTHTRTAVTLHTSMQESIS